MLPALATVRRPVAVVATDRARRPARAGPARRPRAARRRAGLGRHRRRLGLAGAARLVEPVRLLARDRRHRRCSRPAAAATDRRALPAPRAGRARRRARDHVRPPDGAPRRPSAAHRVDRRDLVRPRGRRPRHHLDAAVAQPTARARSRSSGSSRSPWLGLRRPRRRLRQGAAVDAAARDAARRRRRDRRRGRARGARQRPRPPWSASSAPRSSHSTRRMLSVLPAVTSVRGAAVDRRGDPCSCRVSWPTAWRSPSSAEAVGSGPGQ